MTSLVVREVIGGGVLKLERVQVICPALPDTSLLTFGQEGLPFF